ncbi:hypothetical protein ACWD6I_17140 [Streptomyces sp. NPDC002454]|uniref:hypothetical protein n=1 Tax=Streptomyces sp. NPDC002490 TaxID=3154416 RepID=UPI00331999BB
MYGHKLAHTGMGTVAIGGLSLAVEWLVAVSALLVVSGAVLIRWAFHRERPPS